MRPNINRARFIATLNRCGKENLMGRRMMQPHERRAPKLKVWLTDAQYEQIKAAAERDNMSVSSWVLAVAKWAIALEDEGKRLSELNS